MIKKLVFRWLRGELVVRMHAAGMTWANINRALMALGQDIVVRYEVKKDKGGIVVHFGKPDVSKMLAQQIVNRKTKR